MAERLQKLMSQWGVASRRKAEQMILDGRVRLNGSTATLGQKADPAIDQVEVDGVSLTLQTQPDRVCILLHKPAGVVSTCRDPHGRSTVLDLLPPTLTQNTGVHPVGRLDAESTGALLLTNDGEMTFALTHPRHTIPKHYQVWVKGHPTRRCLDQWRRGVLLDGKQTLPACVSVLNQDRQRQTLLHIILCEGRNRQIRRVAEQLGHPVIQLHRTAIGSIQLGPLPSGQYRTLSSDEMTFLDCQAFETASRSQTVSTFSTPLEPLGGS